MICIFIEPNSCRLRLEIEHEGSFEWREALNEGSVGRVFLHVIISVLL